MKCVIPSLLLGSAKIWRTLLLRVPWKLWVSPSTMDTLFTPAVGKRKVVFRSITITADMRFSVLNRLMKPPS